MSEVAPGAAPAGNVPPSHSSVARFAVADQTLLVGGIPVTRLAERIGSTPFFAYDRRLISERVALLRHHLPDRVRLNYAVKANPMPAVVQHLAGLVDGFDVASAFEMRTALDTTIPANRVSFAGPGKTDAELAQAVSAGVILHVESEGELRRLAAIAGHHGLRPQIALRVNPDYELKASGMRMGGGPQQFGIDADHVPLLLREISNLPVEFVGFHIFAGSQNLRAELLQDAQSKALSLARDLMRHASAPLRHLNIGGGFGIPYFPKDAPLDLAAVGANLERLLDGDADFAGTDIIVELGRYIVGEAGVYVSRVVDRKVSRGQVFLVTDGGLHHQLAASGNFGQVIRRNYPVAVGNRMGKRAEETVSVVGCLCTPLDLLSDRVELPRAEVGDLVVIFQSGAYGLTASPTAFLGHPAPVEILV